MFLLKKFLYVLCSNNLEGPASLPSVMQLQMVRCRELQRKKIETFMEKTKWAEREYLK